ncbi:MAG: DivIVA domain-containing protein [Bacilli bacterium]
MGKFSIVNSGYSPDEVNQFLDSLIGKFEKMVREIGEKNDLILSLKKENTRLLQNPTVELIKQENAKLKDKLEKYMSLEETLNKAIFMAQKTSDQMRVTASEQSEIIVNEAKKNANRIINEALLKSEKAQYQTDMLRRNQVIFKKRLRGVLETQLEIVDDIEKIEI